MFLRDWPQDVTPEEHVALVKNAGNTTSPILSTTKEAVKVILWSDRQLTTQMQGQV